LLISIAPGLIGFIYGKGYEPAVRPLELLALAYVGISVGYVGSTVLTGLRKTKPIALVCVVAAVVSLAGQAWATPRWGATGAATVTAITQVGIAIVYSVLAARAMRTRLPLLEICLGTLLLVVVIGGAALIHLPWPVEAVAVAAALGVGLVLTRVITVSDFRRVLARRAVS
jgi:O-antigen/teichoic acid export membrane protein